MKEVTMKQGEERAEQQNVAEPEQWLSLLGGTALALYGLTRKNLSGLGLGVIGGALVFRGLTGRCPMYGALGINTRGASTNTIGRRKIPTSAAVKVEKSIVVDRPAEELYRFWRNFENLPKFMHHLDSVTVLDHARSRWVAKAPMGTTVSWEAEIIHEDENRRIGWRSIGGSDVDNAGSVQFTPRPAGGTEVTVMLQYDPPGGLIGAAMAKIMGNDPGQKILDDLRRFKQVMEEGQTAAVQ
jgi:uncharacterized membrane protein